MIEVIPVHDFRSGLGQKALLPFGKFIEQVFRNQGIQYGISQEFKAFIIHLHIVKNKMRCGFVDEGELIDLKIAGEEAQDILQLLFEIFIRGKKILFRSDNSA
jgi:hypothetical protein